MCFERIHEGICGSHIGTMALVNKALKYGYYLPTMSRFHQSSKNLHKVLDTC